MKTTLPSPIKHKADGEWVKTPFPSLIRYKPSGNYFGRVRVNGKLIRRRPACVSTQDAMNWFTSCGYSFI